MKEEGKKENGSYSVRGGIELLCVHTCKCSEYVTDGWGNARGSCSGAGKASTEALIITGNFREMQECGENDVQGA